MSSSSADTIAKLNDTFRLYGDKNLVWLSPGVSKRGANFTTEVLAIVRGASEGTWAPGHERNEARFQHGGVLVLWKIKYFNRKEGGPSPDPADPKKTVRLLVIGLEDEPGVF